MAQPRKQVDGVGGMDVSERLAKKRREDIEYMQSYTQNFLRRLKNDPVEEVLCSKAYAGYFGSTWTALYNTVPVTVKFDGQKHRYPRTVAQWLLKKFIDVTESNIPKVQNDTLSE